MSRIKCSECGKLAHTVIDGKAYCMDCIPKPTMPVVVEETFVNEVLIEKVERPKPWPDPPEDTEYSKPLEECIEKKPWWKRFLEFLNNPFDV